jgi:membrane protein DedA with SNARE-associated domain
VQGIALAGAIGSVFGSWATYFLGKYGGRPLIRRYGRYVLISEHDLEIADRFFNKFGIWATFLGRVLPVVRTYISIPAGISRVRFWPFTFATFIGSYIWSLFLGWIGFKLGENWTVLREYFHEADYIILAVILVLGAWWLAGHLKRRPKHQ